jgi:hypothetical protein
MPVEGGLLRGFCLFAVVAALFPLTYGLSADNVTLSVSYDVGSDRTYIDDQERCDGFYTSSEIGYPYAVSETSFNAMDTVFGTVAYGEFIRLGCSNSTSGVQVNVTQSFDRKTVFLTPFTEGTHATIEDRRQNIVGGFLGGGNFLGFPAPNFAYELSSSRLVRASLGYDREELVLDGFGQSLAQGVHDLTVTNRGVNVNGTLVVEVRPE